MQKYSRLTAFFPTSVALTKLNWRHYGEKYLVSHRSRTLHVDNKSSIRCFRLKDVPYRRDDRRG